MPHTLDSGALDLLFHNARTHTAWLDEPVTDDTLRQLYDLMKWGPTSMNCSPARILFLRTKEAKERLKPFLMASNVDKTLGGAGDRNLVAYDAKFYDKLGELFPHYPGAREVFAEPMRRWPISPPSRNGTLQGWIFHAGRPLARVGLRSDVRLRQRQGGRGLLRRRIREVELPLQSGPWRCIETLPAQSAPGLR